MHILDDIIASVSQNERFIPQFQKEENYFLTFCKEFEYKVCRHSAVWDAIFSIDEMISGLTSEQVKADIEHTLNLTTLTFWPIWMFPASVQI